MIPYLLLADMVNTGPLRRAELFGPRAVCELSTGPAAVGHLRSRRSSGRGSHHVGSGIDRVSDSGGRFWECRPSKPDAPIRSGPFRASGFRAFRRMPWDLLRTPILGPILRYRHFRRSHSGAMLLLAAVVAIDGFFGPQVAPMNSGWRAAVDSLARTGRDRAADGRKSFLHGVSIHASARSRPKVRAPSLSLAEPIALQVDRGRACSPRTCGRMRRLRFGIVPARPPGSSSAISSRRSSSIRVFKGASFCKYVCPIGQFHFVHSIGIAFGSRRSASPRSADRAARTIAFVETIGSEDVNCSCFSRRSWGISTAPFASIACRLVLNKMSAFCASCRERACLRTATARESAV